MLAESLCAASASTHRACSGQATDSAAMSPAAQHLCKLLANSRVLLQAQALAGDAARRVQPEAMPWHRQPELPQLEPATQAALQAEMQELVSSALEGSTSWDAPGAAGQGRVCDSGNAADAEPSSQDAPCTADSRTGADRGKPRWALTASEAEKQSDLENTSLLHFAESLDFDAYASTLDDAELAAAVKVWIQSHVLPPSHLLPSGTGARGQPDPQVPLGQPAVRCAGCQGR